MISCIKLCGEDFGSKIEVPPTRLYFFTIYSDIKEIIKFTTLKQNQLQICRKFIKGIRSSPKLNETTFTDINFPITNSTNRPQYR